MEQGSLFDLELGNDDGPVEDCEVTTVVMYYETQNAAYFKAATKRLMKHYWPTTYAEEGNLSDLMYILIADKDEELND